MDVIKYMNVKGRALTTQEALKVMHDVCLGVKALHENGFVHRDIKPANIFVSCNNDLCGAVLGDFGLLEVDGHEDSASGTSSYYAPEMLGKDMLVVKASVDIWALGVTFHEMLTATQLFKSKLHSEVFANIAGFQSYEDYIERCINAEKTSEQLDDDAPQKGPLKRIRGGVLRLIH